MIKTAVMAVVKNRLWLAAKELRNINDVIIQGAIITTMLVTRNFSTKNLINKAKDSQKVSFLWKWLRNNYVIIT